MTASTDKDGLLRECKELLNDVCHADVHPVPRICLMIDRITAALEGGKDQRVAGAERPEEPQEVKLMRYDEPEVRTDFERAITHYIDALSAHADRVEGERDALKLLDDLRSDARKEMLKDAAATPEYLAWLGAEPQRYRESVGGNEIWNAARETAERQLAALQRKYDAVVNGLREPSAAVIDAAHTAHTGEDSDVEGIIKAAGAELLRQVEGRE